MRKGLVRMQFTLRREVFTSTEPNFSLKGEVLNQRDKLEVNPACGHTDVLCAVCHLHVTPSALRAKPDNQREAQSKATGLPNYVYPTFSMGNGDKFRQNRINQLLYLVFCQFFNTRYRLSSIEKGDYFEMG